MSEDFEAPADLALRATPGAGARVVIVGAGGGLGRLLTQACRHLQCRLALLDLPQALAPLDAGADDARIGVDAADADAVGQAFAQARAHLGGIDHLFHLVGLSTIPPRLLAETDALEWDRVLHANLRSAYLSATAALPAMQEAAAPSMVFVTSTMTLAPNKGYGAYVAAKSGLAGLVKSLAVEAAPKVRINAVAPSAMLTPFMGGGPQGSAQDPKAWSWFNPEAAAAAIPLGRLCTPADVVGPLLFLSSPMAAFITGQVLHVSGGRVMP